MDEETIQDIIEGLGEGDTVTVFQTEVTPEIQQKILDSKKIKSLDIVFGNGFTKITANLY